MLFQSKTIIGHAVGGADLPFFFSSPVQKDVVAAGTLSHQRQVCRTNRETGGRLEGPQENLMAGVLQRVCRLLCAADAMPQKDSVPTV
jgi:hypothetical protein